MTTLQILRAALQRGYSLQMDLLPTGYHLVATGASEAGTRSTWESIDPWLDQALTQLSGQLGLLDKGKVQP